MNLESLVGLLDETLRPADFARADIALNGLQAGDLKKEGDVRKVAFAVDACIDSFKGAAEQGADLLVVHHGLFWGAPLALTGSHYRRIKFLMDRGLALYACHLPLDAHPVYGNNAQIAALLGLEEIQPFGEYHGVLIGFKGILKEPQTPERIAARLGLEGLRLEFGKKLCSTVGIVSGGAADDVSCAIGEGLDLFITGEMRHEVFHEAQEDGVNMLCLGHYGTETFGVKALERMVASRGIKTCFIDVPTGV